MKALAEALLQNRAVVSLGLCNIPHRIIYDLAKNNSGCEGAKAIANMLAKNSALTSLDLCIIISLGRLDSEEQH